MRNINVIIQLCVCGSVSQHPSVCVCHYLPVSVACQAVSVVCIFPTVSSFLMCCQPKCSAVNPFLQLSYLSPMRQVSVYQSLSLAPSNMFNSHPTILLSADMFSCKLICQAAACLLAVQSAPSCLSHFGPLHVQSVLSSARPVCFTTNPFVCLAASLSRPSHCHLVWQAVSQPHLAAHPNNGAASWSVPSV